MAWLFEEGRIDMQSLWSEALYRNNCPVYHGKFTLWYLLEQEFFWAVVVSVLLYGCTTWTLTKHHGEKAW